MRVSVRKNLPSISMLAGLGAVAFLVYDPLYTYLVGLYDEGLTEEPPTSLAFPALLIADRHKPVSVKDDKAILLLGQL